MVGFDKLTKCGNCGKDMYGFEVSTYIGDDPVCESCSELMYKNPYLLNKYKAKQRRKEKIAKTRRSFTNVSNLAFIYFVRIIMILALIVFVYFWFGACVGNFLNVDESPSGLRWKP